ncbi:MAG: hypothetical protein ACXWW8_07000 [Solirubrobacterales bacterium]
MTHERMLEKAEKAERRCERYREIERRCEERGLYEEALEAERMRNEHVATLLYWRERAQRAQQPEHAA